MPLQTIKALMFTTTETVFPGSLLAKPQAFHPKNSIETRELCHMLTPDIATGT